HIAGFSENLLESLDEISFSFGKERISVLLVMQALVIVAVSFLVSLWASRAIEKRIMGTEVMDMNLRVMLSKVTRTIFILVASFATLSAAGIDMTALSMFGGALGVGLGLGLQKIASNYVSGFIILLDRSIHINDIVSIEDKMGVLTKLTTRYVVLKSADGSEALIPNDTLITSTVVNHTYTDRQVRLSAPVEVGYGSDLDLAMKIMLDAAKKQHRVLKSPEPQVFLRSFADSGIDLELGFWIADLEEGRYGLISDINMEIWREFKKHGIEIPFPQREVRLLGSN
nr:mechanosensitive ion channel [Burkholderiales bacterium]